MAVSAFQLFPNVRLHTVGAPSNNNNNNNNNRVFFHRQVSLLCAVCRDSVYNHDKSNAHSTTGNTINAADVHTTFWGQSRSDQEIQDFCYQAVFNEFPSPSTCTSPPSMANANEAVIVLNSEPPLVIIHNFLSHDQCDALIQAAIHQKLGRSTIGAEQETTDIRTSSTAWLRDDEEVSINNSFDTSNKREALRSFAHRASRLSGLPPENMEDVQIVHYTETQKFDIHTDHLDSFNDLEVRGRLATCLVYLNDSYKDDASVEEHHKQQQCHGGETYFPEFEVSVKPIKGSALFFWNTLERPGMEKYHPNMFLNVDMRLRHAGLPVTGGVKWACNRWMHPISYGAGVRGF